MNDKMFDKPTKGGNSNHSSNNNCSNGPVQSETLTLIKQQFFKTKMCPFQKNKNFCLNESNCHYAHSLDELKPMPNLRNTKLCDYIKRKMPCQNINCKFAHDIEALKPSVHLATYKSAICSFWGKGKCFNGDKCRFAHGDSDMNKTEDLTKLDTFKSEMKNKTKTLSSGSYQGDNNNNTNNKNNGNTTNTNSNNSSNKNIHGSKSNCTDTNYGTSANSSSNEISDSNTNNNDNCNNNCKSGNQCNNINTSINKCNSSEQILRNNSKNIQESGTNSLQNGKQNNNNGSSDNLNYNNNSNSNDMNHYTASTKSMNTCYEGMSCSLENTDIYFLDKNRDSFLKKGNHNITNNNYTVCKSMNHSNDDTSDVNNNINNNNTVISGVACNNTANNSNNNNNNNNYTFSNNRNLITMGSKSHLDHFDNLDIDIDRSSELSHYLHQNVAANLHNINSRVENTKEEIVPNDFIFEDHKTYSLYSDSVKDIIDKIEKMSLPNNREKNDKYTQMIKYLAQENMRLKENLRKEYADPLMTDARQNKKPFSFESTHSTENCKLSNSTDLSKFLICNNDSVCAAEKTTSYKNHEYKNIHPINAPTFEDPNKADDNFSSIIKTIDDILISHNVDSFANIRDDQMEFGNDFHMDDDICKEPFVLNDANNNDAYKDYEHLINNMKSYDAINNESFECSQFIPPQKIINNNHIIHTNNMNNKNLNNHGSSTYLHVDNFSVNENLREKPNVELLEQLFQQSLLHEQLEKKRNTFIGDTNNGNNFHFDSFLQKKTLIPDSIHSKEMNGTTMQTKKIAPLLFRNSQTYVSPNTEIKHLQNLQLQQNKKTDFPLNKTIIDMYQDAYPSSKNNLNLALNLNNNEFNAPYQQTPNYQITKNAFKERNTKLNIPDQSQLNDNINLNLEKIIDMSNGKSDILKKLKDFISNELQQISESSNNTTNTNKYSSNTKIINFSNNNEANENTHNTLFNEQQNPMSYAANKNVTFPNFYRNDALYSGTINSTRNHLITDIPRGTAYPLGFMPNQTNMVSGIATDGIRKHPNKLTSISSIHPTNITSINEKNIWNGDNTSLHSVDYTRPAFTNDWINNKTNDFFNISKSINLGSLH